MVRWVRRAGVPGLVLLLVLAAVLTVRRSRPVEIVVDRPDALASAVIDVQVRGLPAGRAVTVAARLRDGNGMEWSSAADFVADGQGRVDLARDPATSGSYSGVHPIGLLATLLPAGARRPARPAAAVEVTLSVRLGQHTVAQRVIRRVYLAPGVTGRRLTLAGDGLVGTYYAPPGPARRPAVLAFGGSEGGARGGEFLARALASAGYPALGIGYFKEPGLPPTLAGIRLEYFGRAIAFLRAQPQVDPRRIAVLGVSRGSEPAQLLPAYYPGLVQGVIALVPTDAIQCGYPACDPVWTWRGRPLPFTTQFNQPNPTDVPAAVLPYDRIDVPLFLDCGGHDMAWASCPFARAAIARHTAAHPGIHDTLLAYPHAGHGIGDPIPTLGSTVEPDLNGDTVTANEDAKEQIWPRLLGYLDHLAP